MRYLTASLVYAIHLTLRRAYSRLGQGQTFNPPFPPDEVYARLESAVARPRAEFSGVVAHPTLFRKVAALGLGIAQGHVFGNGNKRTALSAMTYMLNVNGWQFNMPAPAASLMMLRIASSSNRMTLEEAATLLGASAGYDSNTDEATERLLQGMIAQGAVIVVEPDVIPAPEPVGETKAQYNTDASAIFERHMKLLSDEERELFYESFEWPQVMSRMLISWSNVQAHKKRDVRRTRHKAVGTRRRPHCGGRSVPKICPPITDAKLGVHHKGESEPKANSKAAF